MNFTKENALVIIEASESNEFVIDLEDVVDWLGYSRKDKAKETITANFEEGVDFSTLTGKTPTGGRPSDSLLLTVDCFKQLCMLSRTDLGKEVRKFYLQVEKEWRGLKQNPLELMSDADRAAYFATQYLTSHAENKLLVAKIEAQQPKVDAFQATIDADGCHSMIALSKMLQVTKDGKKLGRNLLMKELRRLNILMKDNQPYQTVAHWFKVITSVIIPGNPKVTYSSQLKAEYLPDFIKYLSKHGLIVSYINQLSTII